MEDSKEVFEEISPVLGLGIVHFFISILLSVHAWCSEFLLFCSTSGSSFSLDTFFQLYWNYNTWNTGIVLASSFVFSI